MNPWIWDHTSHLCMLLWSPYILRALGTVMFKSNYKIYSAFATLTESMFPLLATFSTSTLQLERKFKTTSDPRPPGEKLSVHFTLLTSLMPYKTALPRIKPASAPETFCSFENKHNKNSVIFSAAPITKNRCTKPILPTVARAYNERLNLGEFKTIQCFIE